MSRSQEMFNFLSVQYCFTLLWFETVIDQNIINQM